MQLSVLRFVSFVALAGVFTACSALRPLTGAGPASTASTAPGTEAPVSTLPKATPPQTGEPNPSAPAGSGNRAAIACSSIVDNIPDVRVNSGKPTVAAAYEVTGAQLTSYFVKTLDADPNQTNGSDWWDQPTKRVDMCLYDGDFSTMTPGPPEADRSAVRVLIVISDGDAQFWASTRNKASIPATDPASISRQCPNQTWPPYGAPDPVPGISVTAKDKGHTEIINATSRTYYYQLSRWPTDQLVCGLGQHEQGLQKGPIAAGRTVEIGEGSTPDVPVTIEIWDAPCGEGCDRPPIGAYVVPVSTIEPVPMST